MTPQREAYIGRCSEKELWLRVRLRETKVTVRTLKVLANCPKNEEWLQCIKRTKWLLAMYRHELARLNGMDRVVRAKEFQEVGSQGLSRCSKCGEDLSINERFCSACGRKILWEKVKQCD